MCGGNRVAKVITLGSRSSQAAWLTGNWDAYWLLGRAAHINLVGKFTVGHFLWAPGCLLGESSILMVSLMPEDNILSCLPNISSVG